MNADDLARAQGPLKERYRLNPNTAVAILEARSLLGKEVHCTNTIQGFDIELGLHPAAGGASNNLCPGTVFLDSLSACAAITMSAVSTYMGIEIRNGTITAKGELDLRGTLAVSAEAQVGFRRIDIQVELDTDASPEQIEALLKSTEKYCVVLQTLRVQPELTITSKTIGRA